MVNYLIGIDTETCGSFATPLTYDIGWQVTDRKGNVYVQRSYVVYEIFFGMPQEMNSAYYAEKIPQYYIDIHNRDRIVAHFDVIRRAFESDCMRYKVKAVFAHNARFDLNALNYTAVTIDPSGAGTFFPTGIEIWDTLKMSAVITSQKRYQKFCQQNGYMTKHQIPQPRATVEILYRYISKDNTFEESHTGLEDVEIETAILAYCFRQHKKMDKILT